MNINIGNNRWVKFVRAPDGRWTGRGHGYRFRVTRARESFTVHSERWQCHVYAVAGGPVIAGCTFPKMKSAIQEGARLADVATKLPQDDSCPT